VPPLCDAPGRSKRRRCAEAGKRFRAMTCASCRNLQSVCAPCFMGAAAAATAATGSRLWLVARLRAHLTPRRKNVLSGVLIAGGVLASGLVGPTP
jgi:hypothetical protein